METKLFFNITKDLWPFPPAVIYSGFSPLLQGSFNCSKCSLHKMYIQKAVPAKIGIPDFR